MAPCLRGYETVIAASAATINVEKVKRYECLHGSLHVEITNESLGSYVGYYFSLSA